MSFEDIQGGSPWVSSRDVEGLFSLCLLKISKGFPLGIIKGRQGFILFMSFEDIQGGSPWESSKAMCFKDIQGVYWISSRDVEG